MTGIPDATSCIRSLNRATRMALPVLLAYAIFAHLIVVSFGTVTLAAGLPWGAGAAGTLAAGPFAAMLCHPGALVEEASPGKRPPGDMPHGKQHWCCGPCLLQGSEPWAPAAAFITFSHERAASVIRWHSGRETALASFAVVPTARGPPAAVRRT
ncbi:hypothetical protein ACFSJ2_10575 [Pseudochelatococcus lubricantis]